VVNYGGVVKQGWRVTPRRVGSRYEAVWERGCSRL
jgi:hypothetical protein